MTDDAAQGLLKDWFKLQDDEATLMQDTAKKLDKVLPTTKVLRFVQVENKLNTLLDCRHCRAFRSPSNPRGSHPCSIYD